jgi:hypothetical protein
MHQETMSVQERSRTVVDQARLNFDAAARVVDYPRQEP